VLLEPFVLSGSHAAQEKNRTCASSRQTRLACPWGAFNIA